MNTDTMNNASAKTEELLEALLAAQKKAARQTRFAMAANLILSAVLIVIIALAATQIHAQLSHAQESLTEVDALIADAEVLIENANTMVTDNSDAVTDTVNKLNTVAADAEVLIENANTMVTDNTDAVTETLQKLNTVDIESLNEAIANLNAAIQPLSNLANLFG